MEDAQVLYNAKDGILAVGFDLDGNVVPSQFAQGDIVGTIQMNVDVVHTKDTYTGDDVHVLDFFSRDESHQEYGVLYTSQNQDLILNLLALKPTLNHYFKGMVETPHQASMQHRITRSLLSNLIGLDKPEFDLQSAIQEISNILSPLVVDTPPVVSPNVTLSNITIVANHSDILSVRYLWFKAADGTWWYNHILSPEMVTASSSCSVKPTKMNLSLVIQSMVPEEVVGEYFMVTITHTKSQNLLTSTVLIDKMTSPHQLDKSE